MFRPMAPDVSVLSNFVANGHQTLHFVSSAPSKIPYGGFSPVRLQTGCQQRPWRELRLYAATAAISPACVSFRSRTYVRRHPQSLTPHTCPVVLGSPGGCIVRLAHLTMTTSALLSANHRFHVFIVGNLYHCQKVPNLLCQTIDSVLRSLRRWLQRLHRTIPSSLVWPSPVL